jgi:hypothetical protein
MPTLDGVTLEGESMNARLIWKRWKEVALLAATAATTACAGSSPYMKELAAPQTMLAPADKAVVTFVRPSGMGFAINFAILDQEGHWIGDAVAKSHFAVSLNPGTYTFIGWAENTAALKATLAEGRTYYVEVVPSMGFGSAHVTLEALTPRDEDWKELPGWMHDTQGLEALPAGAEYIAGRHDDAMKKVAAAAENWEKYSNEEKDARTLRVEDGIPAQGAAVSLSAAR